VIVLIYLQDFTKEERQALALKSQSDPPKFGSPARQKVIDEMHQRMLQLLQQRASSSTSSSSRSQKDVGVALVEAAPTAAAAAAAGSLSEGRQFSDDIGSRQQQQQAGTASATEVAKEATAFGSDLGHTDQTNKGLPLQNEVQQQQHSSATAAARTVQATAAGSSPELPFTAAAASAGQPYTETPADKGLTFLASVLVVAIVALLFKKFANAWGWQLTGVMQS
jgi:hypothetical protein